MFLKKTTRFVIAASTFACFAVVPGQSVAADPPTEVRIALMQSVGPEGVYDQTVVDALQRLAENRPHGMDVTFDVMDAVYGQEAETVMQLLASSGRYDIMLSASAHSDQISNLRGQFPDLMWVSFGSGNYSSGDNHYWALGRVHEAAYLLGVLAAGLSDTGVIGVVGSYPADDINDQLNAYRMGARAVNPDTKMKVAFIESWYDPPKAIEATSAQASAGADVVYQLAGEVYGACRSRDILCLSKYKDTSSMAPDVVVSGTQLLWDPVMEWMADEWYEVQTTDRSYQASADPIWYSMAEGGSDISPYNQLADRVPDDVKALVEEKKAAIIAGEIEVPVILDVPVSD